MNCRSGSSRRAHLLLSLGPLLLAQMASPHPLGAQTTPAKRILSLSLTGYARSLTGIHDAGYDPPAGERRSGFHSDVARLKWRGSIGDQIVFDVHNRIQARVSSTGAGFGGSVAGFGVGAAPGRSVDLESVWIDDERLRAWHDVDRLALTVFTSAADVTVGRQAITWGTSFLFPVADLWAQFSPFELDTEEKPGVDAVRVLSYPTAGLELDAVVADRGTADDLSAALRATWSLRSADVYAAAGKFWEQALLLGGVTVLFDSWKLRAEGVASRHLDDDRWLDPRATIGADWIQSRLTLSMEYHFNGLGTSQPEEYAARLVSETFARGESYFLGRHYWGGLAAWAIDDQERVRIASSALVNLEDGSGALLPSISWDLGQSTRLTLGGLLAVGDTPILLNLQPQIRSEYGSYGDLGYAQISVYF